MCVHRKRERERDAINLASANLSKTIGKPEKPEKSNLASENLTKTIGKPRTKLKKLKDFRKWQ